MFYAYPYAQPQSRPIGWVNAFIYTVRNGQATIISEYPTLQWATFFAQAANSHPQWAELLNQQQQLLNDYHLLQQQLFNDQGALHQELLNHSQTTPAPTPPTPPPAAPAPEAPEAPEAPSLVDQLHSIDWSLKAPYDQDH